MSLNYPDYTMLQPGNYRLEEDMLYDTPIMGYSAGVGFIVLHSDGSLLIMSGYHWDMGSGPAIDTPDMVYASLAHDAFYDLMKMGKLPWKCRKKVDKYFKRCLKDAGMGWLRRQWCYYGVRIGYALFSGSRG